MGFRNQTHTNRWAEPGQYNASWKDRAEKLIQLFLEHERQEDRAYRIAEIGCGAHAPIQHVCAAHDNLIVTKFDINKWDDETEILDLNGASLEMPRADVIVFSGVLEYVNDLHGVLEAAIGAAGFVLFSYGFLPEEIRQTDETYINEIRSRAVKSGWRNHFTLDQVVQHASSIGVISGIGLWKGSQVLLLLRNRGVE